MFISLNRAVIYKAVIKDVTVPNPKQHMRIHDFSVNISRAGRELPLSVSTLQINFD